MGCDGGTIPRRDELVRVKKKPEQVDKNAENAAKWKHCAISQQPLRSPIVSCELGKLYNKEAVIEHLLAKNETSEVANHITKLADVKELKLSINKAYEKKTDNGGEYVDVHASKFFCPVTGIEMNGKQKFCFLWKCGCVLSEKAIKEVKSEVCHKCGLPYATDDIILMNGDSSEVKLLKEKMDARRLAAKLEKKRKKAEASTSSSDNKKQKCCMDQPSTSGVANGIVKEETLKNGGKKNIKDAVKPSGVVAKNGVSAKKLMLPPKALPEYSISKDPNASAAYKSLFTSHDKAKNQTTAHWVTHNPLYY